MPARTPAQFGRGQITTPDGYRLITLCRCVSSWAGPSPSEGTPGDTQNELVALSHATSDTANLQSQIKGDIIPLLLLLKAVSSPCSPNAETTQTAVRSWPASGWARKFPNRLP